MATLKKQGEKTNDLQNHLVLCSTNTPNLSLTNLHKCYFISTWWQDDCLFACDSYRSSKTFSYRLSSKLRHKSRPLSNRLQTSSVKCQIRLQSKLQLQRPVAPSKHQSSPFYNRSLCLSSPLLQVGIPYFYPLNVYFKIILSWQCVILTSGANDTQVFSAVSAGATANQGVTTPNLAQAVQVSEM